MSRSVVLTAVGRDRVGIVAELTEMLFTEGCNLLDSSMTLLRGQFAIILMVTLPEGYSTEDMSKKLDEAHTRLGLTINIRDLSPEELKDVPNEDPHFMISVYGADRPGIVAGITKVLRDLKLNITDVQTKSTGSASQPVFVMLLEVTGPDNSDFAAIETKLKAISTQLKVDVTVQALEAIEL